MDQISGHELLGYNRADNLANDLAQGTEGADQSLPLSRLDGFLNDIRNQPLWRHEADRCADYYDGNQLTAEQIERLRDKGLDANITNLVQPVINTVLGFEAKTRASWKVSADDEQYVDVADALSSKMHEATRESRADRAISDAYASQIKAGFGVVEVSRNSNPFEYPYRVQSVHRREIYWDFKSVQPDWTDCRWVLRKRWFDAEQLVTFFPEHAKLIDLISRGTHEDMIRDIAMGEAWTDIELHRSIEASMRISWDEQDWRNLERRQLCCYEVWYRTYHRGFVLKLPSGRVIEFNQNNPYHMAVVASGAVQPKVAVFDKLRCAFFVGKHRVRDIQTSLRRYPYIPFFGYREDLTGVPYGLIRSMMSPQNEVNQRMQKALWLLSQRRVEIDSDALDEKYQTLSEATRELTRADAFVVTNPSRLNGQAAIKITENQTLAQYQFQIMAERKAAIQEVAGVYSAMMGQNSNASSGLAIQSLVEQGTTTLAEINDNYRFARRAVGCALLDLIRDDMNEPQELIVDNGGEKRRVMINIPKSDPQTGQYYKENDVQNSPVQVALSDVPDTPTYRAQQFAQLSELTKSLPPQMQALVVPFVIEASDIQRRKDIADLLRRQVGTQSPEEAQAAMQAQQETMQQQQQVAMADVQSKIDERQARANKLNAEAQAVQSQSYYPAQG